MFSYYSSALKFALKCLQPVPYQSENTCIYAHLFHLKSNFPCGVSYMKLLAEFPIEYTVHSLCLGKKMYLWKRYQISLAKKRGFVLQHKKVTSMEGWQLAGMNAFYWSEMNLGLIMERMPGICRLQFYTYLLEINGTYLWANFIRIELQITQNIV